MALIEDPEEAREEAEDVAWALRYAQHKLTGKCWAIETDFGPHPGCAEFAPGVSYPCDEDGTQWVLQWEHDGFGPPTPDWMLLCPHHAVEVQVATEFTARVAPGLENSALVTTRRVS